MLMATPFSTTFLDFAGGIGTLAVGHCPPSVVNAVQTQAADLLHLCAIVGTYEPYVRVSEMMNEIVPGDFPKKTILLNSGAEANETAIKIARSYTNRPAVIVFEGAYHGRTNLTLAMTSKYGLFKKGFGPYAPEIYRLPYPNVYRRPAGLTPPSGWPDRGRVHRRLHCSAGERLHRAG